MNKITDIYKYFTINEYFYSSMINNEIFFADSRNFNDPFDSRPIFSYNNDKANAKFLYKSIQNVVNSFEDRIKSMLGFKEKELEYNTKFKTLLRLSLEKNTFINFNKLLNNDRLIWLYIFYNSTDIIDSLVDVNLNLLQQFFFDDLIFLLVDLKGTGVTCGSLKPNCPVMWGHYGNNHTGVCLHFQVLENGNEVLSYKNEVDFKVDKVFYSDEPINLYENSSIKFSDIEKKLLHTKSSKWEYEHEIRLTAPKQGTLKFKKTALKSVIFGTKSSDKNRYSICKLLACLGYNFEIKIARLQTDKYDMKIDKMVLRDILGSNTYIEELGLEEAIKGLF